MLSLSLVLCGLSLGLAAVLTLVVAADSAPPSTVPRPAMHPIENIPGGSAAGRSGQPHRYHPYPKKVNHVRNR